MMLAAFVGSIFGVLVAAGLVYTAWVLVIMPRLAAIHDQMTGGGVVARPQIIEGPEPIAMPEFDRRDASVIMVAIELDRHGHELRKRCNCALCAPLVSITPELA